ncbi:ethylene-responsive transcription factor ERF018 [Cocos nucifera]|uniref:Ethylene-responsive transcription factor ERF018 n=1 Tax=Cocos nucifera TaxID=13894 RepID=A0A8K0N1S1_COCNU|nr:ethylene-responsive transcription factor ERF018 [Cocos nucifera]
MKPAAKRRRTAKIRPGGVGKRRWGEWVLEIRLPHSRKRIWLGSYDCPEKAGRAFDAAARFNFPDHPPDIPAPGGALSPHSIQAAAACHANCPPPPPPQHSTAESSASAMAESSEGCLAADDRSLADLVTAATADAEFAAFEDDSVYELFPVAAPLPPDPDEENWGGAFDPSPILWNF